MSIKDHEKEKGEGVKGQETPEKGVFVLDPSANMASEADAKSLMDERQATVHVCGGQKKKSLKIKHRG